MEKSDFYAVITKKFIINCKYPDFLLQTQELYNQVLLFYYDLFLDLEEDKQISLGNNTQEIMRQLEVLSIVGREKKEVPYPLPLKKIPLYFRRAAINAAIAAGKGYLNRNAKRSLQTEGADFQKEKRAASFCAAVTFYKGTYKEMSDTSISLKVWNGFGWKWMRCRLSGNTLPPDAVYMSPYMECTGSVYFLNIPVKVPVSDGRKAKERMAQGTLICSIQFTNQDNVAAAVVLDQEEKLRKVQFFRGGDEYSHRCAQLLEKIENSRKAQGEFKNAEDIKVHFNQKYWMKLKHITDYYSHNISRSIVDFCVEQEVGMIVLPDYEERFTKYVMSSAGKWSPIHLSRNIKKKIFYKAWQKGIVVLETKPYGCSCVCAVCGSPIVKKKKEFSCPNGHQGNIHLNTARNVGVKCIRSFGRSDLSAKNK